MGATVAGEVAMTADRIDTEPAQLLGKRIVRRTRTTVADARRKLPRVR